VLLLGVLNVFSSPVVLLAHTAIAGWCFVIALLGWGRQLLSYRTPALDYLTESAFPVYLLHQSAIVVPGYFLIQLPLNVGAKFALLLAVSTAVTVSTYHLLVRPFALSRFLFGMKAKRVANTRPLVVGATAAGIAVALCLMQTTQPASGAISNTAASVLGLWYAEGGAAQVEVTQCGDDLCGHVSWLRSPFDEDGCEARDRHNTDPTLRMRPLVGLPILRANIATDASPAPCSIYDPTSGRTYSCELSLDGENKLRLRGYVGIPLIGRTTTWFRVGAEVEQCRDKQDI
jgi:uncharacterized protein (DUF2147 family)